MIQNIYTTKCHCSTVYVVKTWKQHKCPKTKECIYIHIHTMEYYSVIKRSNKAICRNMNGPRDFSVQFSSVQSPSRIQLFVTPWIAARQASLSITNTWNLLKLSPSSQWCHPTISFSVVSFSSCLHPFPALQSSPVSQSFTSGGQSIGLLTSASVLPMNIQDWNPLGLVSLISLQPKDSQESSPKPQFKSINSLVLSFLYSPTVTSIHDYWKNHGFD